MGRSVSACTAACIAAVFVVVSFCHAQPITPYFQRFGSEQGLPQSSVQCVLQDCFGFMWFGTRDGLARYDGYGFTVFRHDPEDSTTLSGSDIRALYEDRSSRTLWIGTRDGGLNRFDRASGKFIRFVHNTAIPTSLSHNDVRAILEDHAGMLWVGTCDGGLNRFDRTSGKCTRFMHNAGDTSSLGDNRVLSLLEDHEGTIWAGTAHGLNRFDRTSGKFTHYTSNPTDSTSLSNNHVWAIAEDRWSGTLWVGTYGGGLNRFDRTKKTFRRYKTNPEISTSISSNNVLSLLVDRLSNTLWVGTYGGGVNSFDPTTETFTRYQHNPSDANSLSSNSVFALAEDRAGAFWVGTDVGGVTLFDRATVKFMCYRHNETDVTSLSHNNVLSLLEDRSNALWVGTYGGGLNRFDRATGKFKRYSNNPSDPTSLSDDRVRALLEDKMGMLWIGTWSGLNHFDRTTGTFKRFPYTPSDSTSLSASRVLSLLEDRTGTLWVGTDNGLNRLDRTTNKFKQYHHNPSDTTSLSNGSINSMLEDRSGMLWIATWSGLNSFAPATGKFKRYQHISTDGTSLSHNRVLSLCESRTGTLWVGTFGGLCQFDRATGSFAVFRKKEGLPNEVIYGIVEDNDDNLWLSTNKGLCKFNPREKKFMNFDKRDGLQDNEFSEGAYHRGHSGRVYFGGIAGFNEFFPDSVHPDSLKPSVAITMFKKFNRPAALDSAVEVKKVIILPYNENDIGFEFVTLSFRIMERNLYSHKLENFDKDWSPASMERKATYTNLDPGEYVFRVRGCNSDGVWNMEGTRVRVIILPPWWARWWARTGFVLCFVGTLYQAYRLRVSVLARRNERLERQVQERTAELNAANRELGEANEEISRQMSIQTEQAREVELANTELHEKNVALDAALLDLKHTQAQLIHSEKMAAVGQLTAGVMHEINNPNAAIHSAVYTIQQSLSSIEKYFFSLLDERSKESQKAKRFAEMLADIRAVTDIANTGSERITMIVNELQHFTKHHRTEATSELVAQEIATTVGMFQYQFAEIVVTQNVQENLRAKAHWGEINQVILNILANAAQADAKTIHISALREERKSYPALVICIEDNGHGMTEEILRRVFEPFFTTKRVGQGVGLGLTIAHNIIKQHGGQISVQSNKHQGTIFEIELPLTTLQ